MQSTARYSETAVTGDTGEKAEARTQEPHLCKYMLQTLGFILVIPDQVSTDQCVQVPWCRALVQEQGIEWAWHASLNRS